MAIRQECSGGPHAHDACASSPFHIALLEQKFAVIHGNETPTISARYRDASFLQLSKIAVPLDCFRPEHLRAWRSAAPIWSRYCELAIKKPGVERRACPSFRLGWLLVAQPPERMCSKLVLQVPGVRNQPHLVVSGRARFVRGLPCKSGLRQHQESIATSCISSSLRIPFFDARLVEFIVLCGNRFCPACDDSVWNGGEVFWLTNSLAMASSAIKKITARKGRLCEREPLSGWPQLCVRGHHKRRCLASNRYHAVEADRDRADLAGRA